MVHRVGSEAVALRRVGADVGDEGGLQRHDAAVARQPQARLVRLIAVVAERHEVLAPPLDPLHRTAEAERGGGDEDLVGIDITLGSEAAADVGHADADRLRG